MRLTIIGVGLIGGSLARALRAGGLCEEVVGCSRDAAHLQRAVDLGVIDRYERDLGAAVRGADVVVVAVPLGAMAAIFQGLAGALSESSVVTDVGSAKASVIADLRRAFGRVPANFVPGHPIAGTECSGVEASFAELFRDRQVILTPLEETSRAALARVRELWRAAGAQVSEMGVQQHDEILAATSHLPHVLAYSLVDTLARLNERREIFRFAAGGFRDFTRIASSDPAMWRDICLANRDALLAVLGRYQQDLADLGQALQDGDGERLLALFGRAKQARDAYTDAGDEAAS